MDQIDYIMNSLSKLAPKSFASEPVEVEKTHIPEHAIVVGVFNLENAHLVKDHIKQNYQPDGYALIIEPLPTGNYLLKCASDDLTLLQDFNRELNSGRFEITITQADGSTRKIFEKLDFPAPEMETGLS